jgi:hypothetical protein
MDSKQFLQALNAFQVEAMRRDSTLDAFVLARKALIEVTINIVRDEHRDVLLKQIRDRV